MSNLEFPNFCNSEKGNQILFTVYFNVKMVDMFLYGDFNENSSILSMTKLFPIFNCFSKYYLLNFLTPKQYMGLLKNRAQDWGCVFTSKIKK